jgi:hypothetical protein
MRGHKASAMCQRMSDKGNDIADEMRRLGLRDGIVRLGSSRTLPFASDAMLVLLIINPISIMALRHPRYPGRLRRAHDSNVIHRPPCRPSRRQLRPLSPTRRHTLRSPLSSRIPHVCPTRSTEAPLQGQETHSHTCDNDQGCWLDERD